MYHPTTRVLAVLALLQSHGRMSGSELARRLEVSPRTLRRYIIMLQDLAIPIETERGRHGAYVLTAAHKLPPMMFTNEEAMALSLGLLAARRLGLKEADRAIASAIAKLERVMPSELKERVRALTETITIAGKSPTSKGTADTTLTIMTRAAKLSRRVRMQYQTDVSARTEREFEPYAVAYFQQKWYAVGYCHLRKDLRSFRLDRVTGLEFTELQFQQPKKFDPVQFLSQSIATLPRAHSYKALLKTDMKTAQCVVSETVGVLEAAQAGVILRGSVDDLDWLARQFAQFPFKFVIHEPGALKAALRRHCRHLVSMANIPIEKKF